MVVERDGDGARPDGVEAGLIAISQHVEPFAGISTQDLPNRIVTPFKPSERQMRMYRHESENINLHVPTEDR